MAKFRKEDKCYCLKHSKKQSFHIPKTEQSVAFINKQKIQSLYEMADKYKIKYENEENDIITELTVYNEKFKEIIITEQKRKFKLPFYISIALYILKIIYYELHFLPSKT